MDMEFMTQSMNPGLSYYIFLYCIGLISMGIFATFHILTMTTMNLSATLLAPGCSGLQSLCLNPICVAYLAKSLEL